MQTSTPAAGPSGSTGTPAAPTTPLQRDFPAAAQLRREDLEDLLCDATDPREREEQHAYFEAFFDSLPEVRALYDEHARLLQRNEQAAARNLALRPELEALRADTRSTFERAHALETEWGVAAGEMQEAYKRFTPFALQSRLRMSADDVQELSEDLANAYVEGLPAPARAAATLDGPLDDVAFVRTYRHLRTLYHRRALLHEKCARQQVEWGASSTSGHST